MCPGPPIVSHAASFGRPRPAPDLDACFDYTYAARPESSAQGCFVLIHTPPRAIASCIVIVEKLPKKRCQARSGASGLTPFFRGIFHAICGRRDCPRRGSARLLAPPPLW